MYITQEADYAVRIIFCLAKAGGRRDARSISEEVCVTLRFSLKILGKLSAAGLVNSFKGNRGGYELARAPEAITLLDVLAAVDGPYVMSRCISEKECSCGMHGKCTFQRTFHKISESINRQLEDVDFQSILDEEQALAVPG
ncbi:MAG: Rrf2 family transcriptional regulator [Oscillospiraceae bacterium]